MPGGGQITAHRSDPAHRNHRHSGRIISVILAESVAAKKRQKKNYVTMIQQCCQPPNIK